MVEVAQVGAVTWVRTVPGQVLHPGDRLRTGADSRVAVYWPKDTTVRFDALSEIEILPPDSAGGQAGLHLVRGILSFFHRDKPGRFRVITRGTFAGVDGTEFLMAVDGADRTTLSVLDGTVRFTNQLAALVLTNGEQAVAELGAAPARTRGFVANNLLQWCFYYPAVLDPAELPLTQAEQQTLGDSLNAYRAGDVLDALAKYPAARQPASDAYQIYHAALLLSVGQVDEAEAGLNLLSAGDASARPQRLAAALRRLVSAVKRQPNPSTVLPQFATELLAASYYEQSRAVGDASLKTALELARQAALVSPQSGFARERVAELEFSFGHTENALDALDKSLALAPRNAQALALKGFLLAAQNRTFDAITWFDRALAVDPGLGNAWLGRGLCRIRRGDAAGGREDLLIAAAREPQRAGLRSYLGKAFADAGDFPRAAKELGLAEQLDTNDPTAWLYSALLNQEHRRINDAIYDLEKSEEFNANRGVYRSKLLLDQDQAVRSANLASMYRDAGMFDVSVREAARAVNDDYGNYSAHLFLASSYNELRDPIEANLRYETPAKSEYLVANLLAPANAGTLSPTISQQEYSPLFERDRLGVVSSTEYLGRGAWTQSGAQFGTFGNFSYDFEAFYHADPGQRVDNDLNQRQFSLALKQQLTPQDSVFITAQQYDALGGDNFQYYNQNQAGRSIRFSEHQDPIAGVGYHHEWNPGVHTLFYVTRLDDTFSFTNTAQPTFLTFRPDIDPVNNPGVTMLTSVRGINMHEDYQDRLAIYSGELQQIFEHAGHTTIIGGRLQSGRFLTDNLQNLPSALASAFPDPPAPAAQQENSIPFRRVSFYGYHQWQIAGPLQLIAGAAYDRITFPENFETMPISPNEKTVDGVSPKAGLIWTPMGNTVVRFAYTRSIAGASLDQSYQLEPAQVAGFVQSFRSLIPESVAGPGAGAKFETFDLSLEQKFHTGTYLGLSGEILNSHVKRTAGAFDEFPDSTNLDFAIPSSLNEHLNYEEKSLQFTANQLLGQEWSFGARYRLSQAVLHDNFEDVPDGLLFVNFQPRQRLKGTLNQLDLTAFYNHPKGFFAGGEAVWYDQSNRGYTPGEPGDEFWQFNAFAGYRSPRRRMEAQIGLLNIANQDYNLNPLNLHQELPRKRTVVARLRLSF